MPEPADSQPQQNPPSTDDNGVGIGDDGAHSNNAVNDQGASHDDRSILDESCIPPNSTISTGEPGKVSDVEPPSGPVTSASIDDGNNPENSQVTSQEETAIRPSSSPRKRPKSSNKPARCKNVPTEKMNGGSLSQGSQSQKMSISKGDATRYSLRQKVKPPERWAKLGSSFK